MPTRHRVVKGDCISSLADQYGFAPDVLWDHPENARLKSERGDPNVLLAGDEVFIPDKIVGVATCQTGRIHRFRRKGVPQRLEIHLVDNGEPRIKTPYRLEVDGRTYEGTTDEKGMLVQWVPPRCKRGLLVLADEETFEMDFGHLEPATTPNGILERLENLGYLDPERNTDQEAVDWAIIQFKVDCCGLEQPGRGIDDATRSKLAELDDATRRALVELHGS